MAFVDAGLPWDEQVVQLGKMATAVVRECLTEDVEPLLHNVRTLVRRRLNSEDPLQRRLNKFLTPDHLRDLVLQEVPGASVEDVVRNESGLWVRVDNREGQSDIRHRFIFPDAPFRPVAEPTTPEIATVQRYLLENQRLWRDEEQEGGTLALAWALWNRAKTQKSEISSLSLGAIHKILETGRQGAKPWLVFQKKGNRSFLMIDVDVAVTGIERPPSAGLARIALKKFKWLERGDGLESFQDYTISAVKSEVPKPTTPKPPGPQPRPVGRQATSHHSPPTETPAMPHEAQDESEGEASPDLAPSQVEPTTSRRPRLPRRRCKVTPSSKESSREAWAGDGLVPIMLVVPVVNNFAAPLAPDIHGQVPQVPRFSGHKSPSDPVEDSRNEWLRWMAHEDDG